MEKIVLRVLKCKLELGRGWSMFSLRSGGGTTFNFLFVLWDSGKSGVQKWFLKGFLVLRKEQLRLNINL